jgi:hypothetical protein
MRCQVTFPTESHTVAHGPVVTPCNFSGSLKSCIFQRIPVNIMNVRHLGPGQDLRLPPFTTALSVDKALLW